MKCLVINLDRSTDRLAHVTAEFAKIGIHFDRAAAFEADAVNPEWQLTRQEVACFQSHRQCWQIIADGTDPYGAIFEDDVVFSADAGNLLIDDGWIPRGADVVKLETYFVGVRIAHKQEPVRNGYSVTRLVGRHLGSAGYIVSREAAQRLLKGTTRLKGTVDYALFSPTLMTCSRNTIYQLMPALCVQSNLVPGSADLPTLIQFRRQNRQMPAIHRSLGEACRVFAHLRNGSLFRSDKIDFVPFRDCRSNPN